MTDIYLGGVLGQKFGKKWSLFVESPAEVIRAINANTKGEFLRFIEKRGLNKFYKFSVNTKNNLISENELSNKMIMDKVYLLPTIKGKDSGVAKIIVGAVLIVVGFVLIFTGFGAGFAPTLFKLGAALIVGGVVQLMTPIPTPPKPREEIDRAVSRLLRPPNSIFQGAPLPLIYGRGLAPAFPVAIGNTIEDRYKAPPPVPDTEDEEDYDSGN